jgi:4-amino-4-deoxychorismate lyase
MMLWIDGLEAANAAPLDRGLEFGDGLFETMAVLEGRVRLLDRHLQRLVRGCERLKIVTPDLVLLRAEIVRAATMQGSGLLKLILTRGDGGSGYGMVTTTTPRRYLVAQPSRRPPIERGVGGARVARLPTPLSLQPRLAGLKHLNRLEQVLLRADVAALGLDEGLVGDPEGRLISGVMSNVFLVLNGQVVTPALERCGIEGAMRGAIIDSLSAAGVSVSVRDVAMTECTDASEMFLTNALVGVWPILSLEGKPLVVGPWARRLQDDVARW